MKVLMVVFLLYMFTQNLNGWKNLFKSQKDVQQVFDDSYCALEKLLGKSDTNKFFLGTTFILVMLNIAFYMTVGIILANHLLVTVWSGVMVTLSIKTLIQMLQIISTKEVPKFNLFSKLIVPVNTIYLLYFAYQYLFVVSQ